MKKYIPVRIRRKARAILEDLKSQHWSQLGGKEVKPQQPRVISFRLSRDYRRLWYPSGKHKILSHADYTRQLAIGVKFA